MKIKVEPTIFLLPEVITKIDIWCKKAKGEVSGLGLIDIDEDGDIFVTDVYLLEQKSSSGNTDLDQEAVGNLMTELRKEGISMSKLRFWWHSHGNGGVFWSGTDDKTIDILGKGGFMVSMVTNKKREKKFRIGMQKPLKLDLDDVGWSLAYFPDEEFEKECEKEFDEKVKEVTTITTFKGSGNYGHNRSGRGRFYHNGRWHDSWPGGNGGSRTDSPGGGLHQPVPFQGEDTSPGTNNPLEMLPSWGEIPGTDARSRVSDLVGQEIEEVDTLWLILNEADYTVAGLDQLRKANKIETAEHNQARAQLKELGLDD